MAQPQANPFRVVSYDQPVNQYVDPKLGEYAKTLGSLIQTYDKAEQIAQQDELIMDVMDPGEDATDEEKQYFSQLQKEFGSRLDQMAEEGRYEDYLPEVRKMGQRLKRIKSSYDSYNKTYKEGLSSIGFDDEGNQTVFDDIRLNQARQRYIQENQFSFNPNNLLVNQAGSAPNMVADVHLVERLNDVISKGSFNADGYGRIAGATSNGIKTVSGELITGAEATKLARQVLQSDKEAMAYLDAFEQSRVQYAEENPIVVEQTYKELKERSEALNKTDPDDLSKQETLERRQLNSLKENFTVRIGNKDINLFEIEYESLNDEQKIDFQKAVSKAYGRYSKQSEIMNATGAMNTKWAFNKRDENVKSLGNGTNIPNTYGSVDQVITQRSLIQEGEFLNQGDLIKTQEDISLLKDNIREETDNLNNATTEQQREDYKSKLVSLNTRLQRKQQYFTEAKESLRNAVDNNRLRFMKHIKETNDGKVFTTGFIDKINEKKIFGFDIGNTLRSLTNDFQDIDEEEVVKHANKYYGVIESLFSDFIEDPNVFKLKKASGVLQSGKAEVDEKIEDIYNKSTQKAGSSVVLKISDKDKKEIKELKEKRRAFDILESLVDIDIKQTEKIGRETLERTNNEREIEVLSLESFPNREEYREVARDVDYDFAVDENGKLLEEGTSNGEFYITINDEQYTFNMKDESTKLTGIGLEEVYAGSEGTTDLYSFTIKAKKVDGKDDETKLIKIRAAPNSTSLDEDILRSLSTQNDKFKKATRTQKGDYVVGNKLYTQTDYETVMESNQRVMYALENSSNMAIINNLKSLTIDADESDLQVQGHTIMNPFIGENENATVGYMYKVGQVNRPFRIKLKDDEVKAKLKEHLAYAYGINVNQVNLDKFLQTSTASRIAKAKVLIEQIVSEINRDK